MAALAALWPRCVVIALCLAVGVGWTRYTDAIKARSPLGKYLMSTDPVQRRHNLGTLPQRWSPELRQAIWRTVKDVL